VRAELAEHRSRIVELQVARIAPAPAPAPLAITPAATPIIEPSTTFKSIPFRVDEVGYFDPDFDESHGDGDMVTIGKDLWFRDMFLFTARLKDIAVTKEAVRINWQPP
jgi:hypothetical protein